MVGGVTVGGVGPTVGGVGPVGESVGPVEGEPEALGDGESLLEGSGEADSAPASSCRSKSRTGRPFSAAAV